MAGSWPRRASGSTSRAASTRCSNLQPLRRRERCSASIIDRDHELVGAYFEATKRVTKDYEFLWNFDLFQNVITTAVAD